jgi:lysophospholipase L1-like esterase
MTKTTVLLMTALLAGLACSAAQPVNILYLGDSLSDFDRGSNHVDRLQAKLDADAPGQFAIHNYSIRGDFIGRLLDRIDGKKGTYALARFDGIWGRQYDWAFVFLGHNDTKTSSASGFASPAVLPKDVESGYRRLVDILRAKGIRRIILLSPASSNYELCAANAEKRLAAIKAGKIKKAKAASRFGEPRHMEEFMAAVQGVAKDKGCEFLDVYTAMKALPDKASLLNPHDGVHLSAKGHAYMAERTYEYLKANKK